MSDPLGPESDPKPEDFCPSQPSTLTEFTNILPDAFTAWLENLKPALEPDDNVSAQIGSTGEPPPMGELKFEGTLRVDCYVTGRLRSLTGTLFVSETGEVESDIFVATAIIDGIMHGDIHATDRVELQSHARVFGFIEAPALAIQPGAVFEGECHFLSSPFPSANGDADGEAGPIIEPVSLAPGFSQVLDKSCANIEIV